MMKLWRVGAIESKSIIWRASRCVRGRHRRRRWMGLNKGGRLRWDQGSRRGNDGLRERSRAVKMLHNPHFVKLVADTWSPWGSQVTNSLGLIIEGALLMLQLDCIEPYATPSGIRFPMTPCYLTCPSTLQTTAHCSSPTTRGFSPPMRPSSLKPSGAST